MSASPNRPASRRCGALSCALFGALLTWLPVSQGALTVSSTRVVYDSDQRNSSVTVANPSNRTFAVQTWVNTAADDHTSAVPFIATPPLFRLNAGKEQHVQINGLPNTLPVDRESLFYFNVQEIPQAEPNQNNQLNIAMRTRIKLFYRPTDLPGTPAESLKALSWSIRNVDAKPQLVVHNPSPYHQSFINIELHGNGQHFTLKHTPMALPMSTQHFALEGFNPSPGIQVKFSIINDYGGVTDAPSLPVTLAP